MVHFVQHQFYDKGSRCSSLLHQSNLDIVVKERFKTDEIKVADAVLYSRLSFVSFSCLFVRTVSYI